MSKAIENLEAAFRLGMSTRPKVGGFPHLAEALRRAGVTRNLWFLPAGESLYLTADGPVVSQGQPLVSGMVDVPPFDRDALTRRGDWPVLRSRALGQRGSFVADQDDTAIDSLYS